MSALVSFALQVVAIDCSLRYKAEVAVVVVAVFLEWGGRGLLGGEAETTYFTRSKSIPRQAR